MQMRKVHSANGDCALTDDAEHDVTCFFSASPRNPQQRIGQHENDRKESVRKRTTEFGDDGL
jgi:hypothetical protein